MNKINSDLSIIIEESKSQSNINYDRINSYLLEDKNSDN